MKLNFVQPLSTGLVKILMLKFSKILKMEFVQHFAADVL